MLREPELQQQDRQRAEPAAVRRGRGPQLARRVLQQLTQDRLAIQAVRRRARLPVATNGQLHLPSAPAHLRYHEVRVADVHSLSVDFYVLTYTY